MEESRPPPPAPSQNPGTMEDLHKRCQNVFPMFFEGAKLLINKGLSNHFQVSHTLTLSALQPAASGYRFGATFVGPHMLSPSEAYPLLLADIEPSTGDLNANIVHAPTERTRCKFIAQIQQGRWQSTQMTSDYKGDNFTASLTLGNPDLINCTGVAVMHYLRSLTRSVSVGAELAYQASPQLPGGHVAVLSVAARHSGENHALAATVGNGGQVHATYYQRCSETLQLGVELETSFKSQEATAAIGYEVELAKGSFLARGSVDSNLIVKSVIEKKLQPLPFTLALCSLINHRKNQYQFGCGLIIG